MDSPSLCHPSIRKEAYKRGILSLEELKPTRMDDDGPCAVPQPDAIQEPIADPLAVFGYTLVVASLLLMLFDAKRRENWR